MGATAPPPPPPLPPLFGHVCTLNEEISSCSMSATARRIIYGTKLMWSSSIKIFASDCTRSCLRARKYQTTFLGGGGGGGGGEYEYAPRPP